MTEFRDIVVWAIVGVARFQIKLWNGVSVALSLLAAEFLTVQGILHRILAATSWDSFNLRLSLFSDFVWPFARSCSLCCRLVYLHSVFLLTPGYLFAKLLGCRRKS
jgi:hypothetical protein